MTTTRYYSDGSKIVKDDQGRVSYQGPGNEVERIDSHDGIIGIIESVLAAQGHTPADQTDLGSHVSRCLRDRSQLIVHTVVNRHETLILHHSELQEPWTTSPNVYKYTNGAELTLRADNRIHLRIGCFDLDLRQGPSYADPVRKLDGLAVALQQRDGFTEQRGDSFTNAINTARAEGGSLDVRSTVSRRRVRIPPSAMAGAWVRA